MDDIRAVMDAAGSRRARLSARRMAGRCPRCFATTYPERCKALVLWGSMPRYHFSDRGIVKLKGIPGGWLLYAVADATAQAPIRSP